MRQASKRARRSRRLMIFIFVLLAALILWGLAALAERLFHYGADATVSAKDPVEEVQDPQPIPCRIPRRPTLHMTPTVLPVTADSSATRATP